MMLGGRVEFNDGGDIIAPTWNNAAPQISYSVPVQQESYNYFPQQYSPYGYSPPQLPAYAGYYSQGRYDPRYGMESLGEQVLHGQDYAHNNPMAGAGMRSGSLAEYLRTNAATLHEVDRINNRIVSDLAGGSGAGAGFNPNLSTAHRMDNAALYAQAHGMNAVDYNDPRANQFQQSSPFGVFSKLNPIVYGFAHAPELPNVDPMFVNQLMNEGAPFEHFLRDSIPQNMGAAGSGASQGTEWVDDAPMALGPFNPNVAGWGNSQYVPQNLWGTSTSQMGSGGTWGELRRDPSNVPTAFSHQYGQTDSRWNPAGLPTQWGRDGLGIATNNINDGSWRPVPQIAPGDFDRQSSGSGTRGFSTPYRVPESGQMPFQVPSDIGHFEDGSPLILDPNSGKYYDADSGHHVRIDQQTRQVNEVLPDRMDPRYFNRTPNAPADWDQGMDMYSGGALNLPLSPGEIVPLDVAQGGNPILDSISGTFRDGPFGDQWNWFENEASRFGSGIELFNTAAQPTSKLGWAMQTAGIDPVRAANAGGFTDFSGPDLMLGDLGSVRRQLSVTGWVNPNISPFGVMQAYRMFR